MKDKTRADRAADIYSRVVRLAEARGVTFYRISKDTGIPPSTFSDWKNLESCPKADKLAALAKYFGVTLEYLIGG